MGHHTSMLLTAREYALPLLLALVIHAAAVVALRGGWNPATDEVRVIKPQIVNSTLLVLEPKARPAPPKPQPAVKPAPAKPAQRARPEPVSDPQPAPVQPQPDTAPEQRRLEAQRRQQRLDELAQSSFLDALASEAGQLAEQNAASEAEAVAQSYRYRIYQQVVANWSRPPSARNGMQAKLLVELVPTGDVVSVMVVESSGNDAFDRSAEAAVNKSRRFQVPEESEIFERHFRRFSLLFRPEDLLR